jgi:type 1 fimbria pilin
MSYALSPLCAAIVIGLAMLSGTHARADTTLAVSGNVVASGCDVDNLDKKVKIGTFSTKDFPTVGSTTAFKAMNITLSNCYVKLTSVQVKFTGEPNADDPTLLSLTDTGSGGTVASGLGVELLDNDGKTIPFNSNVPKTYELDEGENTLSFLLRFKSTRYPVTSGEGSAVMCFDLTYQ